MRLQRVARADVDVDADADADETTAAVAEIAAAAAVAAAGLKFVRSNGILRASAKASRRRSGNITSM